MVTHRSIIPSFQFISDEVLKMCLGIPARVVEVTGDVAKVDVEGLLRDVSLDLCPDVSAGDYVLIHTGFAIQRLNEEEARETLDLLRQIMEQP